jgi:hypothetical protein
MDRPLESIVFTLIAAVFSALGGKRFIYEEENHHELGLASADDPPDPTEIIGSH